MQAALTTPGATSAEVRRAVNERVRVRVLQQSEPPGGSSPDPRISLSAEIMAFVDGVAERSSDVTAAQVDALRETGLSDEAIFELTVVAAVSRGIVQLERGLDALEGGD